MARAALALPILAVWACQSPPGSVADGGSPDAGLPDTTSQLAIVRYESYPAGARELTLRVQDANGSPISGDLSSAIDLRWDETTVEMSAAPISLTPGFTAVLVRGSADSAIRAALIESLDVFRQMRPDGERLAIYRWGASPDQLANFTDDRARFGQLATRFGALAIDPDPMPLVSVLAAVAGDVRDIGGVAPRVMRAVVVLGVDAAERDAIAGELATTVPIIWVPADATVPEEALAEASARIDDLAANAHYALAMCAPTGPGTATISVAGIADSIVVPIGATLAEQSGGVCSLDAIGAGLRAYTPVIDLVFTPDQRDVYDARVAGSSKQDFDLSVRLATGEELVAATAHLHGKGSLGCERKSYTVNLSGPLVRYLAPDSAINELHLISMCPDNRYVKQYTANQIMGANGVFPLQFRYVELTLDGVTKGVYLLLEKTMEELRRDNSGARSVLRRRFEPPDDPVEVKWARDGDQLAIDAMDGWLAELATLSGAELEAAMEAKLDVDRYLRLIATQTILRNGDYVDEAFFVSTDTLDDSGAQQDYYEVMGWDADDIFSGCHYGGSYAFVDPNQLAYCAEAGIDHLILGDSLMYGRYVDMLEQLLIESVTVEAFTAALDATRADILPWFERADICAAMVELIESNPSAVDPDIAQADISSAIDNLDSSFQARHALLLSRIATYRAAL